MRGSQWVAAALALAAAACGAPQTPAETVDRYFRFLARDPIRTLPLLSPTVHRAHGLHVVTTVEAAQWLEGGGASGPAPAASGAPGRLATRKSDRPDATMALDRAQLAWLAVQPRPAFARLAKRLRVTRLGEERADDSSSVSVRVRIRDMPPFVQRFALTRRGPRAPWRIDAIEQEGVFAGNLLAAFVAYPTEATRLRLERSLRRGPS